MAAIGPRPDNIQARNRNAALAHRNGAVGATPDVGQTSTRETGHVVRTHLTAQ